MLPSTSHPKLYDLWIDLPSDFCCVLGRPETGSNFDKQDFATLFILALRRDDPYELAEIEKMIWEGYKLATNSRT